MKKLIFILTISVCICSCEILYDVVNAAGETGDPSEAEVAQGLKQALEQGTAKGTDELSKVNGYFSNLQIKIPFPPEAKKIEDNLRALGLNKMCDDVILSLNRAAENAAKEARPIIVNAIKAMTIGDAFKILFGSDTSATNYLRTHTTADLKSKFKPVIETSLDKVDATKYWDDAVSYYNQLPLVQE